MKVEINVTKKRFWAMVALGVVLIAAVVFAVDGVAPNPGHSIDQIEGLDAIIEQKTIETFRNRFYIETRIIEDDQPIMEEMLGCPADDLGRSRTAIGCSTMRGGEDVEEEDSGFCKVEGDSCYYSWDVDYSFDGGATAHCYCI